MRLPRSLCCRPLSRLGMQHPRQCHSVRVPPAAGFLSTEWYPRNVPEALRKLLLSGVMARLQASIAQPLQPWWMNEPRRPQLACS